MNSLHNLRWKEGFALFKFGSFFPYKYLWIFISAFSCFQLFPASCKLLSIVKSTHAYLSISLVQPVQSLKNKILSVCCIWCRWTKFPFQWSYRFQSVEGQYVNRPIRLAMFVTLCICGRSLWGVRQNQIETPKRQ